MKSAMKNTIKHCFPSPFLSLQSLRRSLRKKHMTTEMMKRMDMMEERMAMMQMMMGQIMVHESEAKKAPVHKHKK
ncbi:hypothetical protein [Kangiella aquimarina]|nr:hypothetical protein [Kangiella aquimarina]